MGDLSYEGSDHRAQLVSIADTAQAVRESLAKAEGWNWAMMDKEIIRAEAEAQIRLHDALDTPEKLDRACNDLVNILINIADKSTPRRKPSNGKGCSVGNGSVGSVEQYISTGSVQLGPSN